MPRRIYRSNQVIHADVLAGLTTIPTGLFHCTITSPPYWRLRSYPGVEPTLWADGQLVCLGAEADPESFIRHLVQVYDGVRRVLRDDGVLFVNLGETYASGKAKHDGYCGDDGLGWSNEQSRKPPQGIKAGDRCGIPERFALAMQADGWWWRDTIIWQKKSPMPSSQTGWRWSKCRVKVGREPVDWSKSPKGWDHGSHSHGDNSHGNYRTESDKEATIAKWADCPGCDKCRDNDGLILRKGRFRTTTAHEPVFMFAKSAKYFCDDRGAAEKATYAGSNRPHEGRGAFNGKQTDEGKSFRAITETRNPRSVWSISTEPSSEKHFAAYPTKLVKKLMDMATSPHGCCAACGSPYAPIVVSERIPTRPALNPKEWKHDNLDRSQSSPNRDPQRHIQVTKATGYKATCKCIADVVPCRVLDPFGGTGTTARVAHHTGRDWCLIEASADYLEIIPRNIARPLPSKKAKSKKRAASNQKQRSLF